MKKIFHVLLFISTLSGLRLTAQTVPQGITYQGIARDAAGTVIVSQAISVKLGIYSPTPAGALEWEEVHGVTSNALGLFYLVIGQGTSTTAGSAASFAAVNWAGGSHFIKISLDATGGTSYLDIDTIQFWSVPYAMYSGTSGNLNQPLRLNDLGDVDTIGVTTGSVLKWNGTMWMPAADNDSDTAAYAMNAVHAATSDTANYALNVLSVVDTVAFSNTADTASFAANSTTANNALNSDYCDTATYALSSGSSYTYWNLIGNTGTSAASNFIGTTDNVDFVLKTNNAERMRITAAGKIGIGTTAPTANLHIAGIDGVLATGTFGTGATAPAGAGTRMLWYPKKGAFRAGTVTATSWNDASIGNYSFATSYNTTASGDYSTAFGNSCISSGANSVSAGDASIASGTSSIAMGSVCEAQGAYSVAMGRSAGAYDTASIALGYTLTATGKHAIAFGGYTDASGENSIAMGYHASTNGKKGSFVFADMSSTNVTSNTADNQFMVRASGGVSLYSNTATTAGVTLAAGGGSWASVSDRNKKEHFKAENAEEILSKITAMDITSWNYKTQSANIRHIGPMAQDLYSAFHFGESDTTVTMIDMDGLNMIAIQALAKKTKELKQKADEVEQLKLQVAKLEKEKRAVEKRVEAIEQKLLLSSATEEKK